MRKKKMGCFIGAGAVCFFALILLLAGVFAGRESDNFNRNKRQGKAEVVGYERENQSDWYQLIVKLPDLNDGKLYGCSGGKIVPSNYPKGMIVDVLYAPYQLAGIKTMEVHLLNDPPADESKVANILKYTAYVMFIIALILIIIGLL